MTANELKEKWARNIVRNYPRIYLGGRRKSTNDTSKEIYIFVLGFEPRIFRIRSSDTNRHTSRRSEYVAAPWLRRDPHFAFEGS